METYQEDYQDSSQPLIRVLWNIKGIVHLNIIFLYIKYNQIYHLDHPVY